MPEPIPYVNYLPAMLGTPSRTYIRPSTEEIDTHLDPCTNPNRTYVKAPPIEELTEFRVYYADLLKLDSADYHRLEELPLYFEGLELALARTLGIEPRRVRIHEAQWSAERWHWRITRAEIR